MSLTKNLDVFIRLSILENKAGLPKGTWSRLSFSGLPMAAAHFPGIAKKWLTPGNLYDQMVLSASRAGPAAEEVVNGILGEGDVFILNIPDWMSPSGYAVATQCLRRRACLRAMSVVRTKKYLKNIRGRESEEEAEESMVEAENLPMPDMDAIAALLANDDARNSTYKALIEFWRNDPDIQPSHITVFEEWLQNPSRTMTELAEDLGITTSRTAKTFVALARRGEAANNRGLLPTLAA